jgi:glucose/arabinose dehydrogenase
MRHALAAASVALFVTAFGSASAATEGNGVRLVKVASGFESPVHVTAPKSEPGRLYVVEQVGRIWIVENGRKRSRPFLDIRNLVSCCGEQGLLSLAFHPRYADNRRLYVDYTDRAGDTRVVEYRSQGNRVLPGTARELLFVDQPYANHNGGQLAFGPDGLLYVGMGDGGAAGDPEDRAQNMGSRLGKLLRLNVDRAGATWQVAALGLRNPWRFSFDRKNGDRYIGDVGQGDWEEIDYARAGGSRVVNYGWDVFEGRHRYEDEPRNPVGKLVQPIAEYSHSEGCSVTGGFVYRGSRQPPLTGRYFYGDYCSGLLWSLRVVRGKASGLRREAPVVQGLSSFGEDADGELYLVSISGTIYRLAAR